MKRLHLVLLSLTALLMDGSGDDMQTRPIDPALNEAFEGWFPGLVKERSSAHEDAVLRIPFPDRGIERETLLLDLRRLGVE